MRLPTWQRQEWRFTTKNDSPNEGPQRDAEILKRLLAMSDALLNRFDEIDQMHDPLGFPWPEDPTARMCAEQMYAKDYLKPARVVRKWLRLLESDPWLSEPKINRALSRKGIPYSLRPYVWTVAIGSVKVFTHNYGDYARLVTMLRDDSTRAQIDLDVPRTYPTHVWFSAADGCGQEALRRLLCAFAAYNTYVNYCQSLNFLGGILLLHLPEELAFWTLVQLIDRRIYCRGFTLCGYYSPDMEGLKRDMFVMGRLIEMKMPELYAHFQHSGADVEWLCSHWLLSLYSTRIPPLLCCRIWDSLILEGEKILFRVSLALVRLIGKRYKIVKCSNESGGDCPPMIADRARKTSFRFWRRQISSADGILAVLRGPYDLGNTSVQTVMSIAFRENLKRSEINELRHRFLYESTTAAQN